jgi:hypothetical protein
MSYINVKENLNQALMVPMWVFPVKESENNAKGKTFRGNDDTNLFNAIDGGVTGINWPENWRLNPR